MKKSVVPLLLVLGALFSANAAIPQPPPVDSQIAGQLPENARVLDVTTKVVEGEEYTFVKFADPQGNVRGQVFDRNKRSIPEQRVPTPRKRMVGRQLQERLDQLTEEGKVKVDIALVVDNVEATAAPASGTVEVGPPDNTGRAQVRFTLNGRDSTAQAVADNAEQRVRASRGQRDQKLGQVKDRLNRLAERHGWSAHPAVRNALDNDQHTVTIELTRREIEAVASQSSDLVAGIDLWIDRQTADPPPPPPVQPAMQRTNIDPYALNYSGRKGGGVGIYMSETGCPNDGFITSYKRLSGTADSHNQNVSGILRAVSPESYVYCRGGYSRPTSSDLNGYDGNPVVSIATNSWGYCACPSCASSCTSPFAPDYSTESRDWDNVAYDSAVAVFFAAGNTGKSCLSASDGVMAPGNGLNIITLGAYDDSNNTIASFSCYGQPQTKNEKPEISAPGVNIYAGGVSMSGTSQATPHAAAFAADMMGAYTWMKATPYLMKAVMLGGATDSITGGYDKVGLGGIDFYSAYYNFWSWWWWGGNGAHFDGSGNVDVDYSLTAGVSYRVVIAWLNRGTYTYDHRADAHPIGMDLDLSVLNPSGSWVAGSASWDNPFEFVNFTPSVSGTYKFRIHRYANRDTSSGVYMALVINWW